MSSALERLSPDASPQIPRALRVRRRHSLTRKLTLWSVALVVVPICVCAFWMNKMAQRVMSEHHARNVATIAQTLATSLAGRITPASQAGAWEMLTALHLDRRLEFVAVTDADNHTLHRRFASIDGLRRYDEWMALARRHGQINDRATVLGAHGDVAVQKAPIWNPPLDPRRINPVGGNERQLEGFIIVGLRQPGLSQMLAELWTMQATAAMVICLLTVPVVALSARRWTAPIRDLLAAIARLTDGQAPAPIDARSKDELGTLAEAFNAMAGKLHRAQRDLRRANEVLEHKVIERTAELQRVNRRLEAEIRDKNEFLRAVSHDLSTPLRNIGGMAGMLLLKYESQLSEDAVNKLRRIDANVKVQNDLINDLMELSRIRSRPGRKELVDLNELLAQLKETLAYDLERQRITLVVADGLPVICAERNRMRQVFQNLLDNAIKYMGDSTARRIEVGWRHEGAELHFFVRDSGRGIAERDLPKVFNVFRRGACSGPHQAPGKGVGLASVKTIVECYGGRVWAESRQGQGSTFHVTLDSCQAAVEQAVAAISSQ